MKSEHSINRPTLVNDVEEEEEDEYDDDIEELEEVSLEHSKFFPNSSYIFRRFSILAFLKRKTNRLFESSACIIKRIKTLTCNWILILSLFDFKR